MTIGLTGDEKDGDSSPAADEPARLAAMLEAMPDALIVTDSDGAIVMVNRQLERLFGYDRAELLGRSVDLLVPDAVRLRHRAHRLRFRDEPQVRPMGTGRELEGLHRDGHALALEISLSPLPNGEPPCVMATLRDVSARRAADAERRRVLAALDATRDAIAVFDADTLRITHVNQGATDQLGYRREQLVGSTPSVYLPNLSPADLRSALAPLLGGDIEVMVREVVQRRADGHDYPVEVVIQRVEGGNLVSVSRDITDRKVHEEAQERRARFLNALTNISTALLGGSWGRDAAHLLARCARELIPSDYAIVAAAGRDDTADADRADQTDSGQTDSGDQTDSVVVLGTDTPSGNGPGAAEPSGASPPLDGSVLRPIAAEVIASGVARRLDALTAAPDLARYGGFDHVLAVPLAFGAGRTASLLVARKRGGEAFHNDDGDLLAAFATQAGVAAELAEARLRQERYAVLEDRERIARDLHDRVIQRLFATGMRLQALAVSEEGNPAGQRAEEAIDEIDTSIRELRSAIFALSATAGGGLRDQIVQLATQHTRLLGFTPTVHFDGVIDIFGPVINDHIVSVVTEALSNIARHANATEARVELRARGDDVELHVSDNGGGIDPERPRGNGLDNLVLRANQLGGHCEIKSSLGEGTSIRWTIPTVTQPPTRSA